MPSKPKKVVKTRTARPIHNVVVISDLHVGCQLGLCRPEGGVFGSDGIVRHGPRARLDEGGRYSPSRLQRVVWSWWEEFWEDWVPTVCRGEPFAVVCNGDALDGVHHKSTHQWSHNLADQEREAEAILKPVVEACEGRYYHIRGTEAHAGQSGESEERLARSLGAIPNGDGQYARFELWLRVGPGLAYLTHHIGTTGSMQYESTAPMREIAESYVESGRWGDEPPDWVGRSHRHRNIEVRIQTKKGFATVFTTPAWQLKTPFAFKVPGARQARPQIGGSLMRAGDEDLYTRHKVWTLSRPKEEQLCETPG
jgi:hypothetical protein